MRNRVLVLVAVAAAASLAAKKPKVDAPSPLDVYVNQANSRARGADSLSPGSTWQPGGAFTDMARDLRASQIDDLVTIVVTESASAVSTGSTKTSRQSSAVHTIPALLGKPSAAGALANTLNTSGKQALDGQATTTRENTLNATISARVIGVMPNGYLVLEGTKKIVVNSENQLVTVRGVARPADLTSLNTVSSNQLAELDIRINGKGVVNDAIRRPFFLYRLLLGLLPF
jgi:flagellar L-ring protein FlgH